MPDLRDSVRPILDAALAAVEPRAAVRRALRVEPAEGTLTVAGEERIGLDGVGRVLLVGAGKAAAGMARGALDALGDRIDAGAVVAPHGTRLDLPPEIDAWEAAHPVPDAHGLAASAAALDVARAAGPLDLVLCLLSGGASALWAAPPAGVSLSDLQRVTEALPRAGAPIGETNAVRRHLSLVAGGRLAAAAAPARVVTLAVSDVVGSPPETIGSGPTSPDPTTFADALEVLRRRGVEAPPAVLHHLQAGAAGEVPETPEPGGPLFRRAGLHVVARCRDALDAAAREAERRGLAATVVADDVEGEAREVGARVAALAREARARGTPAALLLGGETTVTVRGDGRGGRNQELALAAAAHLEGEVGIVVAALGTDGVDGPTDAAGAVVDGGTVGRGRAAGLDPADALARNDAHAFLRASGDLLVTGPTGTNVNDVILVLVG